MFKIKPVWLIGVKPISSQDVVFLGVNLEKLVILPSETYLGIRNWLFRLDYSPHSSG